jgi:SEC-C motif-containing protein
MTCVCGRASSTEECCLPIIEGTRPAETAEDLMRSRYAAYVLGQVDHVVKTHDPATRDDVDRDAADAWSKRAQWDGLDIVATTAGGATDDEGTVEFVARYRLDGASCAHHERSRFKRIEGAWHYVDGDMIKPKPAVREGAKVGRNEPCPCGSGKKYKKCHGA